MKNLFRQQFKTKFTRLISLLLLACCAFMTWGELTKQNTKVIDFYDNSPGAVHTSVNLKYDGAEQEPSSRASSKLSGRSNQQTDSVKNELPSSSENLAWGYISKVLP